MTHYRVIILGGGPAGSLSALFLLQRRPDLAGDILILEAKRFPREKICGGGVSGRVTRRLRELGLEPEVLPRVPLRGFTACYRDMRHRPEFGNRDCFVVRRSALDAFLLCAAAERGAEVRFTPAVGACRERRGVRVMTADGSLFRAQVLVAADGVNGRSREWFAAPHRGAKTLLLQTDAPFPEEAEDLHDSLVLDFTPPRFGIRGYVWFFPSLNDEGQRVVNAGISGGGFSSGSARRLRECFRAVLKDHPEMAGAFRAEPRFRAYPERNFSILQRFSVERVIFVGEQLGVDPFTGEGLGICADSAAAAAGCIARALEEGDFSFRGYASQLLRAPFFPLYLIGTTYWPQSLWRQPCFLFFMSTREPSAGGMNVIDYYAKVFSGLIPGEELYTLRFWRTVLRDAVGVLPEWLSTSAPTPCDRCP
ncbi:NAD(P)/FAD-dependent oxidoreductase [Candidatus Solincola tengchongensis]|uniref:NAD(P)/FAD-dependent oxidoreductase n=1 Tax=Candidatus Solincola tengchongensis TaxID=2900693 RepID=UPI00257D4B0A